MDETLIATFSEVEQRHWWCVARNQILVALVRRRVPEGGRVLDVGCGTGYFLESLGPGYRRLGVDASPVALALCRQRGLTELSTDLAELVGGPVDALCLFDVLEHLDDDAAGLAAALAHLAPGGTVIATVPAFPFLWSKHDDLAHHRRRYRRQELQALFEHAGLEVRTLTYFNRYLFPLASAYRLLRRWLGRDDGVEFRMLPRWLDGMLRRVFLWELPGVLAAGPAGLPGVGLSLLAVGVKGEEPESGRQAD